MNKIKVLNENDINNLIDMKLTINAVEKAYLQKAEQKGKVWPLVFYEYEHNVFDLDIRSGNLDDSKAYGLKVISYNENNIKENVPKVCATSLIFDANTGLPLALLNAAPITSYRTGAAAAIGAKYLAKKNSKNLLVVGCGNIAMYSIVATLIAVPSIENVYISNPKSYEGLLEKYDELLVNINIILSKSNIEFKGNISCVEDIENAVKNSDIIITATPSERAMIKSEWVNKGTHFSCMGACMSGKQEIDSKLFSISKSFADDMEQCIKSGEIQTAILNNETNGFDGEIGEVIKGLKGRTSDEDITIFDSTGLFIQDLSTAIEILNKVDIENIGIEVEI